MIITTKINTEYSYKITDILLQNEFEYKQVNNNICLYVKDNICFKREKIPFRFIYVYKYTEYKNNEVVKVYTKKSEVKKLLQHIEELTIK